MFAACGVAGGPAAAVGDVADQRAGWNDCGAYGGVAAIPTAEATSRLPAALPGTGVAVWTRIAFTWSGVRFVFAWRSSAAAPEIWGAENDVPLIRTYPGAIRAENG